MPWLSKLDGPGADRDAPSPVGAMKAGRASVRDRGGCETTERAASKALRRGLAAALVAAVASCAPASAARDALPKGIAGRPAARPVIRPASKAASTMKVASNVPSDYLKRPEVLDYIDTLVAEQHFDRDALLRLFADVHYNATAARLMMPASGGTRRDWNTYRARFVEPVRLAAGYRFWEENAALLQRAERDFGVPPEIIVGIIGVETVYGRNTGSFKVLDALTTLAFDYPNRQRDRSGFFREQLTEALLLGRDTGDDVAALRGSYAGAIGMPQFMPGSIRSDAIDYDGDGRVDLVGSVADVVGSVANFLARHGWARDQPTHYPLTGAARIDATQAARIDAMVEAGSVPTFAYAALQAAGLSTAATPGEPLALIDLPAGVDASERPLVTYLAGTQNFHVITRYNRSYFYAFSVIELGGTIKALREAR